MAGLVLCGRPCHRRWFDPPVKVRKATLMDDATRLILAFGIASYGGAVESVEAYHLARNEQPPWEPLDRLMADLNHLCDQWPATDVAESTSNGIVSGRTVSHVLREARAYLTEHQEALDQMLAERGVA